MELRQLRYFVEAAKTLNFTESSRNLFITQSTLSQQIKQLETELGIPLFDRIGKKVLLTEAGESFLPYAKKTLQEAEFGKQKIIDLQNIKSGNLRIGVTYSLSPLLTESLLYFTKAFPAITIEIVYCSSYDLLELLRSNEVDFILSFQAALTDSYFESLFLFESKLSVVVHKDHPWATYQSIDLNKLKEVSLALLSKDFTARTILDTLAQEKGLKLSQHIELNEVNILLQLVKSERWITVLSQATIFGKKELKAIPIKETGCSMNAAFITLKNAYKKKTVIAFAEILLKRTKKLSFI